MMGEIGNKVKKIEIEAIGRKSVYSGMLVYIIKPHTCKDGSEWSMQMGQTEGKSICENLVCD